MAKGSRTRYLAARLEYEILSLLQRNDGEMRSIEVEETIGKEMEFDEWERHEYPNGGIRWITTMHFYSVDLVKAGFIRKERGHWFLTDAGAEALTKYSKEQLYDVANKAYHDWDNKRNKATDVEDADNPDATPTVIEDIKAKSDKDISDFIQAQNPYDFQDMVAALLRAMGYYTPFIAPKGKDGGVDIIAYSDPLGATKPILKVQVKHYSIDNPVSADVIRSIAGVSHEDVAVVVTSGRFAEPAKAEARQHNVRLIDGFEFIALWIEYFGRMTEEDKNRMPIEPIYFIKKNE